MQAKTRHAGPWVKVCAVLYERYDLYEPGTWLLRVGQNPAGGWHWVNARGDHSGEGAFSEAESALADADRHGKAEGWAFGTLVFVGEDATSVPALTSAEEALLDARRDLRYALEPFPYPFTPESHPREWAAHGALARKCRARVEAAYAALCEQEPASPAPWRTTC